MKLLLIGAGGHGRVVRYAASTMSGAEVIGVLADSHRAGDTWEGLPVLGTVRDIAQLDIVFDGVLLGIGDNAARERVATQVLELRPDCRLVPVVHASAVVAPDVQVGDAAVIMAGAVVHPGTRIGRGVVVNTRAGIDHDCVLEEWCSVAPGATLGGNVHVGRSAIVAIGATVLHGQRIGMHALVAAGAVVTKEVPEYGVAAGVPARTLRRRAADEPYL